MSDLWIEAWTRPGDPNFGRIFDYLPTQSYGFNDGVNRVGGGDAKIARSFAGLDDLLSLDRSDLSLSKSSLIRVYSERDPDNPIMEWLPTSRVPAQSKDDPNVEMIGSGIKSVLRYARTEAWDWDGSDTFLSQVPDWTFGGVDILQNGGFETVPFPNGGFEDGNNDQWQITDGDGFLTDATALIAVNDPAASQAGDWYGLVNPGAAKSGALRTFSGLFIGETYTVTGFMLDPTASGLRWRAGVTGAATATHTNAYEEDGYWWAEVDNAAQGAGASDGTWQSFTITFEAGEEQTQLVIIYDDAGAGPDFRIDTWDITGPGVGLYPWTAKRPDKMVTFRYQTATVRSGTGALEVQGFDTWYTSPFGKSGTGRIEAQQPLRLKVGHPYTAVAWIRQDSGVDQNFSVVLNRQSPRGTLGSPGSSHMMAIRQDVPSGVWTKLQIDGVADVEEVLFEVSWHYEGAVDSLDHLSPVYFIDDAHLFEGLPATSIGDILTQLYDHATNPDLRSPIVWDNGQGTDTPYLVPDFDATNDSAGVPWDESEREMRITMRMDLGMVMDRAAADWDYEYRIVPDKPEAGTWLWQVYNPGGMSVDHTTSARPAVQGGADDVEAQIRTFAPDGTDIMVEGLARVTSRSRSAALMSAFGRIEASRIDREMPSVVAIRSAAVTERANIVPSMLDYVYVFTGDMQDEPLSDYDLGDELTIHDPPEVQDTGRFADVTVTVAPDETRWECHYLPNAEDVSS